MKASILAVDDEEDIQELIKYNLDKEGYGVIPASSGEEAVKLARKESPDLIILDLMLPGMDGLEVCKLLKNDPATKEIPLLMLTAKGEESDIVIGLELGAEDYMVKPFSPKVLIARVKALLRRRKTELTEKEKTVLRFHDLQISAERREVLVEEKRVDLTATEFNILWLLAGKPGWVFSRAQIVDAARGEDYPVTDRSVDVHIVSLRKKLGKYGKEIDTVRGVGYRFSDKAV